MGIVHRENGYRFTIYVNDHEPPHVHVASGGGRVIVEIKSGVQKKPWGLKAQQLRAIGELVKANQEKLLQEWEAHHGKNKKAK